MALKHARPGPATPWSYRKGNSPLHRLEAGAKLLFVLALSLAAFIPNLYLLGGIVLVLGALSFAAGSNPAALLRGSAPLFFMVIVVFLFGSVEFSPPRLSPERLPETVIFCVRLGAAFAAGSLLFFVTTTGEIRKSLARLETRLRLRKFRVSLSISLMLGFMKSFFETWEDLDLAWRSRGGGRNLSRLLTLVPLALEKMMLKAAETASALESRGAE